MQSHKDHPEYGARPWFRVAAKDGKNGDVLIYDEIGAGFFGGGITPENLFKEISALKLGVNDTLTVHINSPGGSFFDGNAIHNNLRTVKAKVVVRIDGVAASAASIVAMAGDRIEMPANSMLFIHNPWMLVAGDAHVMRKAAERLDGYRDNALGTYLRRAGEKLTRDALEKMMDNGGEGTWLSAEDSVKHGLADVIDEPVRAQALAQFDFSKFGIPVPKAIASAKDAIANDMRQRRERLKLLNT